MSASDAYNSYLKNEVEGASQGRLIVMMYDASIRFMKNAIKSIEQKDIENAHNSIIKAENIIYELIATLNVDDGGDVARNLLRIYDFTLWTLVEANTSKSIKKVEEAIKAITPLRQAWKELLQKECAPKSNEDKDDTPPKSINFAG